jgi:hypothetical protein
MDSPLVPFAKLDLRGAVRRGSLLFLCGLAFLANGYADVYGTPDSGLVQRTLTDFCTGCLLAYTEVPLSGTGQTLSSWSFYADQAPSFPNGDLITPVIYNSSMKVIGIGTTDTVATNGQLYNFAFGLTSGTNVLAAGDWLGWRDGGVPAGTENNGHISLSFDGSQGIYYYSCNAGCQDYGTLNLGDPGGSFSFTGPRTYSVNFTTTPEPAFYGLLALGLSGLVTVVSRRKKAQA